MLKHQTVTSIVCAPAVAFLALCAPGYAAPEPVLRIVSPLAMEAPYDGFAMDNARETLATFERLGVTLAGKSPDGLTWTLDNWSRLEWVLPTPSAGRYMVSLLFQSGAKRPGKFGCVVGGKEYVTDEFKMPGRKFGHGIRAVLVRVPDGQTSTRMFVAGDGFCVRRVAFSRVTRALEHADGKLVKLAPASYRTVIRRGAQQPDRPACVVLVPPDAAQAEQARRLAQRLRVPTRAEPELKAPFPAHPLSEEAGPDTNLILFNGRHAGPLARAMARAAICSGRPSKGWRIRTIPRPFRGRANVIVLAAKEPAALAQACEALVGLVRGQNGERVYDKFLAFPPDPEQGGAPVHVRDSRGPDDPWWQKYEEKLTQPQGGIKAYGAARQYQHLVSRLANTYWTTGNERHAELCKGFLLKMAKERGFTTYGRGTAAHMALHVLVRGWDRVEQAAVFSDEERLRIVNYLLDCLASDQGFPRDGFFTHYTGKTRMRHNHQTVLGLGMMTGYMCFSRLYELGLADWWKAGCDALIANATAWGHAPEDAPSYEPGGFQHVANMLHCQGLTAKGAKGTELWPQTLLRFVATIDSFGFPAAYGNCWTSFKSGAIGFVDLMAEDWGWPARQFIADHRIRGFRHARPTDPIAGEKYVAAAGSTEVGGTRPPSDPRVVEEVLKPLLGLAAVPMGRGYYGFLAGQVGNELAWQQHEKPRVPPYEKTADKIQYRSGWGPQHEYLLFDTIGWACKSHMDLGAIIHYCAGGRLWIVDSGYAHKGLAYHSTLELARDGQSAWKERKNPGSLRWAGLLYEGQKLMEVVHLQPRRAGRAGPFRFTCRVNDHAGATWERTVSGGAGKGLQIEDVVTAEKPGEYEAVVRFRFLGELAGKAGRWRVRQIGAELPVALQTVGGDQLSVAPFQPEPRSDSVHSTGRYPGYAFLEDERGEPVTLQWTRTVRLEPGRKTVFRATLGPPRKSAQADRRGLPAPPN